MTTPNSKPASKPGIKPTYISSSGNVLETPPFSARFSRFFDDAYNFFGLYVVSLLSLDPYTAAQNSQFNTQGRPNAYQDRARWGAGMNRSGGTGGSGGGGGFGRGGGGGGGGGGAAGGGNAPRRQMGTVDDVRGPECGSCG